MVLVSVLLLLGDEGGMHDTVRTDATDRVSLGARISLDFGSGRRRLAAMGSHNFRGTNVRFSHRTTHTCTHYKTQSFEFRKQKDAMTVVRVALMCVRVWMCVCVSGGHPSVRGSSSSRSSPAPFNGLLDCCRPNHLVPMHRTSLVGFRLQHFGGC